MKKYEFTGEVKSWFDRTLHQIRATISFGDVNAGDVGGWIEKEENLSRDGKAYMAAIELAKLRIDLSGEDNEAV